MEQAQDIYERYRLNWLLENNAGLDGAIQNALGAAIRLSQVIQVLSELGLEPNDAGKDDPTHVGANLWGATTCLNDALILLLRPVFAGITKDDAEMILDETIGKLIDDVLAGTGKIPEANEDALALFYQLLRAQIKQNDPEMIELAGQIIDAVEDQLQKTRSTEDSEDEPIIANGFYDAMQDKIMAIFHAMLSDPDKMPSPENIATALVPAIADVCEICDLCGDGVPDEDGLKAKLCETLTNWSVHLNAFAFRKRIQYTGRK